jgi:hypothetical protein
MATDPRSLKGAIVGPGGPLDRFGVVIDAGNAVLLDDVMVAMVEPHRDGHGPQPACIALLLSGRINHSVDRAEVLFMFDVDGAAAIVTELIALGARMDADELAERIQARRDRIAADEAQAEGGQ